MNSIFNSILTFISENPIFAKYFTTSVRWIFVILAAYILIQSITSLLLSRVTPEVWGYLYVEDGDSLPITHWENIIGRANSVDLQVPMGTVSKSHALLIRRPDGRWMFKDLNSKNGTQINGVQLIPAKKYLIHPGDHIRLGGVKCTLATISVEEERNNEMMRDMAASHRRHGISGAYGASAHCRHRH